MYFKNHTFRGPGGLGWLDPQEVWLAQMSSRSLAPWDERYIFTYIDPIKIQQHNVGKYIFWIGSHGIQTRWRRLSL